MLWSRFEVYFGDEILLVTCFELGHSVGSLPMHGSIDGNN